MPRQRCDTCPVFYFFRNKRNRGTLFVSPYFLSPSVLTVFHPFVPPRTFWVRPFARLARSSDRQPADWKNHWGEFKSSGIPLPTCVAVQRCGGEDEGEKNGLGTSILASFKMEKCAEDRRRRQFVWWRLWKGWSNWDKVRSKGRETKDDGTRCRKTRDTQRFSEKSSIRHRIRGRGEEVNTSYRCSQIIIVIIEKGNARCKITQITARRPIVLPPRLSKV